MLVRTLDAGIGTHGDLTIDASGTVYVARFGPAPAVFVFPPGQEQPSLTITKGVKGPTAIAVDASGTVYVANGYAGNVNVYAHGAKSPIRTLRGHFIEVTSLAFDASGNVYVGDRGKQQYGVRSKTAKVVVYPPGSSTPSRIIRSGIQGPVALRFDTLGNLYVGNVFVNSQPQAIGYVAVYAPGGSKPLYSTGPVDTYETLMGLDSQNNLYVGASSAKGVVLVYPQGSAKPSLRIPTGTKALQGIGVSPL
jgi:sugar lactone lactonase YvrE